jgi:uncharacterized protein YdaU (DUF1376 family)
MCLVTVSPPQQGTGSLFKMITKEQLAQFCMDNPYKTPAFQFYPESWFGSGHVSMMSEHERGIHASLIFSAWLEEICGLKDTAENLSAAARSKDENSIKKVLSFSWFLYNGFWFSLKLCKERLKQVEISVHRRNSANFKWHKKGKKQRVNANALQMEGFALQNDANLKKEIEIENRSKLFKQSVNSFINIYPQKMLDDFIRYWSEFNRSGKKMKFELQETWELSKRLATWASRDNIFKANNKNQSETPEQQQERLARICRIARQQQQ